MKAFVKNDSNDLFEKQKDNSSINIYTPRVYLI